MSEAHLSFLMTLIGYLSGSILYGYFLPRVLYGVDVREYGDGNPGAFNAGLACSKPLGVVCALLDMLKAIVPVAVAFHGLGLTGWYLVMPVLAPFFGHLYPCTLHFRGGKAITAAFGSLMGLLPVCWLSLVWAICILVLLPFIRDHAKLIRASLLLFLPAGFVYVKTLSMRCVVLLISLFVGYRHLPEESRLKRSKIR